MKKFKAISVVLFFSLFLTGCEIILFNVPPSQYSLRLVVSEIAEKFEVSSVKETNTFLNQEIGNGVMLQIKDTSTDVYIFKLENETLAKERWNSLLKKYGKWTKKDYLNLSLVNQGYLRVSVEDKTLVTWWRNDWIVIVYGRDSKRLSKELSKLFELLKSGYTV